MPSLPVIESRRVLCLVLVIAGAATVLVTFWLHAFYTLPNHDNLIVLLGADRLVRGGRFYYDIFDPDPPLIFILLEPVDLFAKLTGLDPYIAFSGWVSLLIVWSAAQIAPILLHHFDSRPFAGAFSVLAYIAVLCLLPGYQFGQREHIATILFCPWLFHSALEDREQLQLRHFSSILITAIAAIGLLIKPFFLLLPMGMLLFRAVERRSLRAALSRDCIVFSVVAVLYMMIIILLYPEYLRVARLAVETYRFLDQPIAIVVLVFCPPLLIGVAAWTMGELLPLAEPFRTLLRHLAVAVVLLFGCAVAQHKTWYYHNLPALILMPSVLVLLILAVWPSLARMQRAGRISAIALMSGLFSVGWLVTFPCLASNFRSREAFMAEAFPHTLAELTERRRAVLAITIWGLDPVFPAVSLLKDQWASRTALQWLVPAVVDLSQGSEADRLRAARLKGLLTHQMVEDLERYRPAVVAVQTSVPVEARDNRIALVKPNIFDALRLLSEEPAFRRSWAAYHQERVIPNWTFYVRSSEIKLGEEPKGRPGASDTRHAVVTRNNER